jgi:hypothetical protein
MADFARRLREAGYAAGDVTWSTTLTADPRRAGIDASTMKTLREAMERAGRRPVKAPVAGSDDASVAPDGGSVPDPP